MRVEVILWAKRKWGQEKIGQIRVVCRVVATASASRAFMIVIKFTSALMQQKKTTAPAWTQTNIKQIRNNVNACALLFSSE